MAGHRPARSRQPCEARAANGDGWLEDYPNITKEDIEAALEFASQLSDYQTSAYEAVA